MGPSHIPSSGLVSGIYGKHPAFCCFEDEMVWKIFFQFLTVSVLGPKGGS